MLMALAESAARRSRSYWLLARLVLERPGSALLAELDSTPAEADAPGEPLADEVGQLGAAVHAALGDRQALDALEVDYTRLFAGLAARYGPPPPFASVALESRLMGDAAIAVEAAYLEAGFAPPAPEAGPPDHLGAELRFLAFACHREMEAWQAGDRAAAAGWVERERRFLDEHLMPWVPAHCERLARSAETPFYRAVASLIGQACRLDREDMVAILDDA
ncbi:MAG: molecular chaperone TorD family protein [Burkholderiales bacterium]